MTPEERAAIERQIAAIDAADLVHLRRAVTPILTEIAAMRARGWIADAADEIARWAVQARPLDGVVLAARIREAIADAVQAEARPFDMKSHCRQLLDAPDAAR